MTWQLGISFLLAYLIGAIPFSILIGKIFYGKDVREYGSGNAGATNTFRVLGVTAGSVVLGLDIAKGIAAVLIANVFYNEESCPIIFIYFQMELGLSAAIGHIFPVYLKFNGGKGVATFFGVVLYLFPIPASICMAAFFITYFLTKYVSLSSMIASVTFMIAIFIYYVKYHDQFGLILFAVAVPSIIIFTHRKNILRLLNGTETKMTFTKQTTT